MTESIQRLIAQMDEKHWLRLLVCVLPGLIASKVGSYDAAPSLLRTFAPLLLLAGIGVYACWKRIRRGAVGGADETEDEDKEMQSAVESPTLEIPVERSLTQISDLYRECGGDFNEVMKLLGTESKLHPEKALPAVIEETHHRKTFRA